MAVVTSIYNVALSDMLGSGLNWTSANINVALFSASTFTATDTSYTTSGTEVANGNGYTTGGVAAGTRTVSGTSTVLAKITGGSGTSVWTSSGAGFTAVAAKVYIVSGHPIAHVDFGGSQTASGGGTFTITWDSTNGVFNLSS